MLSNKTQSAGMIEVSHRVTWSGYNESTLSIMYCITPPPPFRPTELQVPTPVNHTLKPVNVGVLMARRA